MAGVQGCIFGCLGFGDCIDAVHIVEGLATVEFNHCIGCGACSKVCPRSIITLTGFLADKIPVVACSNKDKAKDANAVCKTPCVACNACAKVSELFTIADNLSKYNYGAYTQAQYEPATKAMEKCPTHCIHFIGKLDSPSIPLKILQQDHLDDTIGAHAHH